jgi:predicted MFS family arabinose efflux permease
MGLMYFGCNVSFASLPVFLPTIISEMKSFTPAQSNALTAPPYVFCFFAIIICSKISDKVKNRGYFVAGSAVLAAVGYLILAITTDSAIRYFAIFLCTLIFVSVTMILIWAANNSGTDSKRAGALSILATIGQCGPLLGTRVFPTTDAPYYRPGMWVSFSFSLVVATVGTILSLCLRYENKKRDRLYGKGTGSDAFDEHIDAGELGSDAPRFRYVC